VIGASAPAPSSPWRIGVWVSHPVQYLAPWFRYLAGRLDLEVFYAHRQPPTGQAAAGFGVAFDWDVPLLEGYRYRFLQNVARRPGVGTFSGCDTPEITDTVRRGSFDAFVIFGWNRKSALQTLWACRRQGVLVLMRGDSHLGMPRSAAVRTAKYLPYRLVVPRLVDGHLYVGQRNREYLEHYGVRPGRLFHVPHFIDNDYFSRRSRQAREDGQAAKIRENLGIPPGAFVFVFAGKLIEKKRPGDLVGAFALLSRRPEAADVHLLYVGDGPLRPELHERAAAHRGVHFAGFRNQTEMPAYYASANAVVLPSDGGETWGLVVNEAAACGLPAIVSDAVGCGPDMIEEGRTGYVFPVGDVRALADRMLALRGDCERRPAVVREAIERTVAAHSFERAALGLEHALRALVRGGPGLSGAGPLPVLTVPPPGQEVH
jgi:glycosyltransferase involved in cell wall biosynthesis